MLSKTHTMNLGISKNKTSQIVGTSFALSHKINLPSLLLHQQNM